MKRSFLALALGLCLIGAPISIASTGMPVPCIDTPSCCDPATTKACGGSGQGAGGGGVGGFATVVTTIGEILASLP